MGFFPCLLWSQGNLTLQPLWAAQSPGRGAGVALWGQCDASEASQDGLQSMMVHADGRAEIGHHRTERDSTQALALVHAGPRMRCRQLSLSPLLPSTPRVLLLVRHPLALLPPELTSQKRNKRVGDPKLVLGPAASGRLCQCVALPMGVRKWGRGQCRGEQVAVGIALGSVYSPGLGRGHAWVLSSGVPDLEGQA